MTDNSGVDIFVSSMIESGKKKKEKPTPQTRINANPKEVENILDRIQKEIQQKK